MAAAISLGAPGWPVRVWETRDATKSGVARSPKNSVSPTKPGATALAVTPSVPSRCASSKV